MNLNGLESEVQFLNAIRCISLLFSVKNILDNLGNKEQKKVSLGNIKKVK